MNYESGREQAWQEWRAQLIADRKAELADQEYFECTHCCCQFNVYRHDECPNCGASGEE